MAPLHSLEAFSLGVGRYLTTNNGSNQFEYGAYGSGDAVVGLDLDASAEITFTFGSLNDFTGAGQSINVDLGLISVDLNYNGDGSEFTGLTFSFGAPLPGRSIGYGTDLLPENRKQSKLENSGKIR